MLTVGQILTILKQTQMKGSEFGSFIGKSNSWMSQLKAAKKKDYVIRNSVTVDIYERFPEQVTAFLKSHEIRKIQNLVDIRKSKEVKYTEIKTVEKLVKLTISEEQWIEEVITKIKGPLFQNRKLEDLDICFDESSVSLVLKEGLRLMK